MNENVEASWKKVLHADTLKENIITAAIFSMAFEMLKSSIVEKLEGFYVNGFDKNGPIIGPEYKDDVLSLNKSPVYASLKWLADHDAVDDEDIKAFEYIKKCRNTLAHEMLLFASNGVDFDVGEAFDKMLSLLRKIEIWWFVNLEMAIDPDAYPPDFDVNEVTPGPVWTLKMLVDIALGPAETANAYYEHLSAHTKKSSP